MRTVGRWIEFPFEDRPLLQFSDAAKVRVHPDDHVLRLKPDSAGRYPTDANLYVRGPELNPTAARLWRAIQVHADEVLADDGTPVATVRYRLNNGTADYWWNGSAWAAPAAGDWNTHAELQTHLQAFPVTSRKIRIVFGLRTTDAAYTPTVHAVQLIYDADVMSDLEELVYRTLVQQLKTIRAPVEVALAWPGGTTADLDTALQQLEAVTFDGALAVFNHTDDSGHGTDLLSSYNASTHVVTLTGSLDAGKKVVVRLQAVPLVAFTTHPDFNEVSHLPAITIEGITQQFKAEPLTRQAAVNVTTLTAVWMKAPRQSDFVVDLRLMAARGLDLVRLADAVEVWLRATRVLRIAALDARTAVVIDRQIDAAPRPDESSAQDARLTVRLKNVECWIYPAEAGYGVGQLVASGSLDATVQ